jgi:hypothetical protein
MNAPRKLRSPGAGKPLSPLTRLKLLPLADREIIFGWCDSAERTLADARAAIHEKYSISLSTDTQLCRFRDWHYQQQLCERVNTWTEDFEEQLKNFNPSASLDQVRQFVIATLMKEAMANGNSQLALKVLDLDIAERSAHTNAQLKREKLELDRDKFTYLQKKDLEKAMDALSAEIKDHPQSLAAFQAFKESIHKASH